MKKFYFRVELSGEGETKEDAFEHALEFARENIGPPPLESELKEPPILGTEYTIEGEEV